MTDTIEIRYPVDIYGKTNKQILFCTTFGLSFAMNRNEVDENKEYDLVLTYKEKTNDEIRRELKPRIKVS